MQTDRSRPIIYSPVWGEWDKTQLDANRSFPSHNIALIYSPVWGEWDRTQLDANRSFPSRVRNSPVWEWDRTQLDANRSFPSHGLCAQNRGRVGASGTFVGRGRKGFTTSFFNAKSSHKCEAPQLLTAPAPLLLLLTLGLPEKSYI
jgi:hypothetical protein